METETLPGSQLTSRECDDLLLALEHYRLNTDHRTRVLHHKRIEHLRKRLVDIAYGVK